MNQPSDDLQIRELFRRMKQADARNLPAFDEVVQRRAREPNRGFSRHLVLAVACCAVVLALLAVSIIGSQIGDRPDEGRPVVAEDKRLDEPPHAPQVENGAEIDFDHLRLVVDEHFRETEAIEAPNWSTRTDSLLVLNFDVPPTQE